MTPARTARHAPVEWAAVVGALFHCAISGGALSGCADITSTPAPAPADDAGLTEDARAATDAGPPFDWHALAAEYGVLETVAGRGALPEGNGWLPAMEGGLAVDAELSRPHITAADDEGRLYVADKEAHAIRRIDVDGTIHTIAGTGVAASDGDEPRPALGSRLSSPNGLWVRGDGTVYVYDAGNDRVRRIDRDGTLTTLFVVGGVGDARGLWVADDESVAYVSAGTAVKRWTPAEGVVTLATGFVSLGNLHVAPDGALAVTDCGRHRAFRIDPDGTVTAIAGNGTPTGGGDGALALETGLEEVRGIFFHPRGGYFLATHEGGQVWYVDTDARIHLFLDGNGSDAHGGDGSRFDAPGEKIAEPRAVTLAPNGDVLVTENDVGFVRRVRRVH